MKEAIRQRARELGFDECRFTTAERPNSAARLQHWLSEGRHGEMSYLQRNAVKRVDPQLVLAGASSIVTLAVSYANADDNPRRGADGQKRPAGQAGPPTAPVAWTAGSTSDLQDGAAPGAIARYARYLDYHDTLAERLRALAEFINQVGGAGTSSLWYVDTGPILERDLAERAGIGFIGKHTNLISRHLGNWILLSEVLTTLELEPDSPEKNRCGSCARCLGACPTGAITGPFRLDARRCISYLTIELKGPIPAELRPAIGNRIFGCDDCLAACPWNRFAREGEMMKRYRRPALGWVWLADLLGLDDAAFRDRFAGTPILRAKRRGLLRNVCVALGNVGDSAALPLLERALSDREPLIAEHARWAIDQIEARQRKTAPAGFSKTAVKLEAQSNSEL